MPIFCLNRTQFALLPFSQFLAAVMRHEAASWSMTAAKVVIEANYTDCTLCPVKK